MTRILLTVLAVVSLALPGAAFAEFINHFESDVYIDPSSRLEVTETIQYVFTQDRHGIFRDIPLGHPQEASNFLRERYIDVNVTSVLLEGEEVPYELIEEDGMLRIKIGDPSFKISGLQTYEIKYEVEGALTHYQYGGTELFWNVTGHEWPVGMRSVRATLRAPEGMLLEERACYVGEKYATASCGAVGKEGDAIIYNVLELPPGDGVSIAQGLDPLQVQKVVLEKVNSLWLWLFGIIIWFILLIYFVYNYRTEHKTGNAIVPQYEPYKDFKPMYTGLLIDGSLNPEDISACIVYLAKEGYLKITKIEGKALFFFEVDDYKIEVIKEIDSKVGHFQKDVLDLLFDAPKLGASVTLSKLKWDTSKQQENRKLLIRLRKDLARDLEETGFFQYNIPKQYIAFGGIAVFILIFQFLVFLTEFFNETVLLITIVLIFSILILLFAHRRRTPRGYEALDHLEGFKEFLSVTEKERLAFHNAPSKNPQQFMDYLPYAIALGVEKEWAEVFKDITIPNPDWYEGGSTGSFSATNLSTSLGAFGTTVARANSSSGSSASSGGGFSGGGAGGGGGGSW